MFQILEEYEDYLVQVKQSSENTVSSYMRDLRQFAAYLQELNIAIWMLIMMLSVVMFLI